MDNAAVEPILKFYNVLSEKLSLEDCENVLDLNYMLPILAGYIESGTLSFVDKSSFSYKSAVEFLHRKGSKDGFYATLDSDAAESGDVGEVAKILISLLQGFRNFRPKEFQECYNKLSSATKSSLMQMMDRLEDRPDLSLSSSMVSSENNHQNNTSADTAAYKIKATELESKVKQIEVVNASLTEQLSVAQNELTELENKQEVLNNSIGIKQSTIDELQKHIKELLDDIEVLRYDNSQLQRDQKNSNDKLSRMSEKYTSDVKAKENELSLMYRRLDDYVKQLAEKEMVENRVKFLDQQLANSHCTQKELKEDLEKALNRANMAETQLVILKKNKSIPQVSVISSTSNISLSDELNNLESEEDWSKNQNSIPDRSLQDELRELGDSDPHLFNEQISKLKTRIELLDNENKHLCKVNEDIKQELSDSRSSDTQSVMEKALEIEKIKQECETIKSEFGKLKQKELRTNDKCKQLDDTNTELNDKVRKLEESLDKARAVIQAYSITSDGYESVADILNLRNENEKLQLENQKLLQKMDQFKHESTQEQRLITSHWYQTQLENFQLNHGLGANRSNSGSLATLKASITTGINSSMSSSVNGKAPAANWTLSPSHQSETNLPSVRSREIRTTVLLIFIMLFCFKFFVSGWLP